MASQPSAADEAAASAASRAQPAAAGVPGAAAAAAAPAPAHAVATAADGTRESPPPAAPPSPAPDGGEPWGLGDGRVDGVMVEIPHPLAHREHEHTSFNSRRHRLRLYTSLNVPVPPTVLERETQALLRSRREEAVGDAHFTSVVPVCGIADARRAADRAEHQHEICQHEIVTAEGRASIPGAVFTLVNTTVGAGTLSVPFALRKAGLVGGLGVLLLSAVLAALSACFLVASADYSAGISYRDLAVSAFGRAGARTVEVAIVVLTWGISAAYLIVIKDIETKIVSAFWGTPGHGLLSPDMILLYTVVVVVYPLCLLKKIRFLSYTSVVSFVFMLYLAATIVVLGVRSLAFDAAPAHPVGVGGAAATASAAAALAETVSAPAPPWGGGVRWFNLGLGTLYAFPLLTMSFTFHPNIAPVYAELRRPTRARITFVSLATIFLSFVVYSSVGVFGYINFTGNTCSNVLRNFAVSWPILIGEFGVGVCCCFCMPLLLYPTRENILSLLFRGSRSNPLNLSLVAVTLGTSYLVSITPHNSLGFSFGLLGSTLGVFLILILPAAYYLRLQPQPFAKCPQKWVAAACLVVATGLSVAATFEVVYSLASHEPGCIFELHPQAK